ncbi:ribonuclease PH, partial [Vibrio parahaemolyticus V-223/04]
LWANS